VIDAHIADPQSTDIDGTILITVNPSTGNQVITYGSTTHVVPIKARGTAPGGTGGVVVPVLSGALVIQSLLPNPVGDEADDEELTLRNTGTATIMLDGWTLRDADNHEMPLTGQIAGGASRAFLRDGAAITLNNAGDTITLFSPGSQPQDSYTYSGSHEGLRINTGH